MYVSWQGKDLVLFGLKLIYLVALSGFAPNQ